MSELSTYAAGIGLIQNFEQKIFRSEVEIVLLLLPHNFMASIRLRVISNRES